LCIHARRRGEKLFLKTENDTFFQLRHAGGFSFASVELPTAIKF
jgi:hypothetical protein